jgi:preprotein translocase subunit SecG
MMILFYLLLFAFLFICVLLTFVILIQESKSTGLGASFGGGDSSDSLFGTATAQVLKKFTAYLGIIFVITCVVLSLWTTAITPPAKSVDVKMSEEVEE